MTSLNDTVGNGWVRQRCRVSCVTGVSNWYWLTVGHGLLSSKQVWVEGECFYFFCFFTFIHFPLSPSFSSPLLSFLFLISLSLGDDTKWPIRIDGTLNPSTMSNDTVMSSQWRTSAMELPALLKIHVHKWCQIMHSDGFLSRLLLAWRDIGICFSTCSFVRPSVRPSVLLFVRQHLRQL